MIQSIPKAASMFPIKHFRTFSALLVPLILCTTQANANPHHIALGIVAQPKSSLAEDGKSVTLSVLTKGPVKTLQWRKNGRPIASADKPYLEVVATQSRSLPDQFDVVIQDAFGNSIVSAPATVEVTPAQSTALIEQNRNIDSEKLHSLFNLIRLFDLVSARVTEPIEYRGIHDAKHDHFRECPDRSKIEIVTPKPVDNQAQRHLSVELNDCFIPKANRLGDEAGVLISGKYLRLNTSVELSSKHLQIVEQTADQLTLRFPYSKESRNSNVIDFDIVLNGRITSQTETNRSSSNLASIRQETYWARGTTISNPQTSVNAQFISGKYIQESFGAYVRDEFLPKRETESFDDLTLKINGELVTIHGAVTKIHVGSKIERFGQFNISMNRKHVLKTHSVVTAPAVIADNLPHAPKLNGFFLNDNPGKKSPEPLKLVSPNKADGNKLN